MEATKYPTYVTKVETSPRLVEKSNWLTGYKWLCVVTAHQLGSLSSLTMGVYQNVTHLEYSFTIHGDNVRITQCVIHNDHVSTGSNSKPYNPENYPSELIPLFDELIALTRAEKHFTAQSN